jgi:hypothetical protein
VIVHVSDTGPIEVPATHAPRRVPAGGRRALPTATAGAAAANSTPENCCRGTVSGARCGGDIVADRGRRRGVLEDPAKMAEAVDGIRR